MRTNNGSRVGRDRWARRSGSPLADGTPSGRALPRILAIVLVASGTLVASASPRVALSGRAMGTNWSVTLVQPDHSLVPATVERAVAARLEELEALFSTYRTQSALSRFNDVDHTDWVPVAPELVHLANESREISELTGGAFDVTVLPLVQLWGFGSMRRSNSIPSSTEIAVARDLVGWRHLEVRPNPPALRKAIPRLGVDFSSMAKGFAADAVSELLTRLGAPNHLVQVGGDLRSAGSGVGAGWLSAIEDPRADLNPIACVVALTGQALSTSGDSRNFFSVGGRRYGHIVDPRTGRPPSHDLASVSVVHASCATSSALATALFVLGPEDGVRLATAHGFAALFLIRDGATFVRRATPEFERLRSERSVQPRSGR